jgi:hypothetical protein
MSDPSQPLSSLEQQLVGLLDEHDRLGSHADDIASRVRLARAWLEELTQEAARLQAAAQAATGPQRQQLKREEAITNLNIKDCEEIISNYDAVEVERAGACARCILVIPEDGAVYRLNVKREDDRLKDVHIKKARFVGGAGQAGMRFAVASMQHTVLSQRLECTAVYAGCELHAVAALEPDPPAFLTVCSMQECAGLPGHFDVVASVERVRLLPPAWVTGIQKENETNKKNFDYWERHEMASADSGGWTEAELKKLSDAHKMER